MLPQEIQRLLSSLLVSDDPWRRLQRSDLTPESFWVQCAGGFALEGRGGLRVERIEGCFSNVIGLSLPLLRRWLSSPACC